MLCLDLSRAGDLQKALLNSPTGFLAEHRVKFYAAEIVSALSYLHQLGLLYRDLKPGNILLGEDGHVQLVDLGGAANVYGGELINDHDRNEGLVPLFDRGEHQLVGNGSYVESTERGSMSASNDSHGNVVVKERSQSVMGTLGYVFLLTCLLV